MKLTLSKREGKSKKELTQIRFKKDIPAVIYDRGKGGEKVVVKGSEFIPFFQKIPKGYLPTTIFELEIDGKEQQALIKEIQYDRTTYQVIHLDFIRLEKNHMVTLHVPVSPIGAADSVGVKLGGFLREMMRHVRVRCLPKDIPTDFKIYVKDLAIGESKRVKDLEVGENIHVQDAPSAIIATIAKK